MNTLNELSISSVRAENGSDQKALKKARSTVLTRQLRESAPASLSQFLREHAVVNTLIEDGQWSRDISYAKGSAELGDAKDIRAAFRALEVAWRGSVSATFVNDRAKKSIRVTLRVP